MELTPRTGPDANPGHTRGRSPWAYGLLTIVLIGLGVVVWQGLTSASLYFLNADEAVAQRLDLGDKRFRLQGTVLGDTVAETEAGIAFEVAFNGVRVEVRHDGDPPELFQPGIPVVLEGRWSPSDDHFDSDTIKVKHSADYEADNQGRLEDAEDGRSEAPSADEP